MPWFKRKKKTPPVNFTEPVRAFVDAAMTELQMKTAALDGVTHFGQAAWNLDQESGSLVFDRKDGIRITTSAQIIGTYNTADETWLWGWDNPSVVESLRHDAQAVRNYGQTHAEPLLTERKVSCPESDCWKFTALACKLCDAQAAYRGPAGTVRVFMTFKNVQLAKRPEAPS
jgi:hypothetical protein